MKTISVPSLPFPLECSGEGGWSVWERELRAAAPPRSDLFTDPFGTKRLNNAPMALFPVAGDFLLSARVSVGFSATFDAGVLVLFQDADSWAKLCFEFSPQRRPMVVSVVTKGLSDDCNSVEIPGNTVHLRLGKRGKGFVFHYSQDGTRWNMVRVFSLQEGSTKAGFLVQAPTGEGCKASFDKIQYRQTTLKDYRSGE